MLDRARRRLGQGVPLVCARQYPAPFRAGSFPVLVCTEVPEHTPDPSAALRELARVAGAHGRIVVSVPNETMIDRAKRMLRSIPLLTRVLTGVASEGNEWHLRHMDLGELRRPANGVGRTDQVLAVAPLRYLALLRPGKA